MVVKVDDETLERIFSENGLDMTVTEVRDLLSGIIAAPPPPSCEPEWLPLVTPNPTPVLRETLLALHDHMRAVESKDGLAPSPSASAEKAERLHALRIELTQRKLDGFIIPRVDEHQGEHVPRQAERLNWLTGFTGSAGVAIVLLHKAAFFVDNRYTLQVSREIDKTFFELHHLAGISPAMWLATHAESEQYIGFDPWLHTPVDVCQMKKALEGTGIQLTPCHPNPLDSVWHTQPRRPLAPIVPHPLAYAGQSGHEKRCSVAADLIKKRADAAILTAPDSIAWLLNIRGGDIPYTPLPLSFAILHADASVELFLDKRKLTPTVLWHMGQDVHVSPPEAFEAALEALGRRSARVLLDMTAIPIAISNRLCTANAHIVSAQNPCARHQAQKNEIELRGLRAAHCRDGVALVRFLCWLEMALTNSCPVTELTAANKLYALRREGMHFRGLSFPTISATGDNSAIIHYCPTKEHNRKLYPGTLYLVDSGAQYLDGTTDVTRTVALGPVLLERELRRRFTQILKGHIALATAVFPMGTTGSQLDILARTPLWADGIDYDHGTGHGVGSYLKVHEGPHKISPEYNNIALISGMIVSNEPGYYKAGAYGIRIESLLSVCPVVPQPTESERFLLTFEILTLVPLDRNLIDISFLSKSERAWVDSYHVRVRETLTQYLDKKSADWLKKATASLSI